jgi:hypothetical protein
MDSRTEIARVVSMLRSLLRGEIEECERAIRGDDLDRLHKEISEVHDRLSRAIYVLNRLR